MIVERQQKGDVSSVWDFREVNGQHGQGVYFHIVGHSEMIEYYSRNGEQSYKAEIHNELIKDCSKLNLDYWGAKEVIYNNPTKAAFIFKHKGVGIPTSKEILITDLSKLKLL